VPVEEWDRESKRVSSSFATLSLHSEFANELIREAPDQALGVLSANRKLTQILREFFDGIAAADDSALEDTTQHASPPP
jgi:hypothetical protein